ncbi:uncharacterized protein B0P05DRAFT_571296 [Gilbertella persicaria]|uniref:uncharacterized protein n=1 Tax=Gilbertella persicaria TaxID=101096 RepID=UPI00221F601C|nr:uncharacterized protein B0P05DRAFT_571296 [Gilbertella persicaria]KAI8080153.1 hypothetical protein B0P05DRAFT_571296 [Gilbertella persicaria]
MNRLAFDRLPDELMILILSQPVIALETLRNMQSISKRINQLVLHVLNYYRLPAIQIGISIDQEGKNRITTQFVFSQFCPITRTIRFILTQPQKARRYYTNKAIPVIRFLNTKDTYNMQQDIRYRRLSSASSSSPYQGETGEKQDDVAKKTLPPRHSSPSLLIKKDENGNKLRNYRLQFQKNGIHTLKKSAGFLNAPPYFKLTYQISDKQHAEYYLAPIELYITFDHLVKEEGCQPNKHSTVQQMVNWIQKSLHCSRCINIK